MTKEKIIKLKKHLSLMQEKLDSPIPIKHANRAESYKRFLRNEIDAVKKVLEIVALEGVK